MQIKNRVLDHIVYCVPDLKIAMAAFSEKFGIPIPFGGQHLTQGTHNAIMNLGEGCYLEFLAIDKFNTSIQAPRWMGIDLLESQKITRWALKTKNIFADAVVLKQADFTHHEIKKGSRKTPDGNTLKWELIVPLGKPEVDVLPFMVDWKDSIHPTVNLPDICKLKAIRLTHPDGNKLTPILNELGLDLEIGVGEETRIEIEVETPNGAFWI